MQDSDVAYFLELRLRFRRNPEARALADRCLRLVAQAAEASPAELTVIEGQVEAFRAELALRFGEPRVRIRH